MSLADELKNDPLACGYAGHLPQDPQRVVELLTAQSYMMLKPITAALALTWAAAGPMAAITDASNNVAHAARASCLAFLAAVAARVDIDMGDPNVKSQFDAWLQIGLISQQAHDSIIAMATQPASRADVLGIPAPSARDIINALKV